MGVDVVLLLGDDTDDDDNDDDPVTIGLGMTLAAGGSMVGGNGAEWNGSFCKIDSLIFNATFSIASVNCKLGVQLKSSTIRRPLAILE
jgi:hypothetical protein